MGDDVILVIVVVTALLFDFTNGFHDTANVVATSISTRAMPPRVAVTFAAILNFVGAFISLAVAATVAKGIVDANAITPTIVFAGLIGAIAWNLATWYFGLPSSSSHALIGGIVGATFAADGTSAINGDGLLGKVIAPALVAPVLAFVVAGLAILVAYLVVGTLRPGPVTSGFRLGQFASGGLLALSHGTNDAQKTMGIIALALVAHGNIDPNHFYVPNWVVISSATAIAAGTYIGGWRIIKTMASRIIKMDAAQGFTASGAGAAVILASSHFGFPLSTTHVINGGILGAGAAKRFSAVRWGIAGNIAIAWVLTLPMSACIGALVYGITRIFGTGAAGPVVVSALLLVGLLAIFVRRVQQGSPVTATGAQG
jgi:PiT family inorganic phosphate transporter